MKSEFVYKILTNEQWETLKHEGSFVGSPDDLRDGFIHLSLPSQVVGTLEKHFSGQEGLVLLKLHAGRLGAGLRVEKSRGGQDFPHLYRELCSGDVVGCPRYLSSQDGLLELE
jgi:uncharacterized protein (DUF952 family)